MSLAIFISATATPRRPALTANDCVERALGRELVRRRFQRQAGEVGEFGGDLLAEAVGGVDSGADGGAAGGELVQAVEGLFEPVACVAQLSSPARPSLSDGERGRVLEVRAGCPVSPSLCATRRISER
jgi:hypothetical protein